MSYRRIVYIKEEAYSIKQLKRIHRKEEYIWRAEVNSVPLDWNNILADSIPYYLLFYFSLFDSDSQNGSVLLHPDMIKVPFLDQVGGWEGYNDSGVKDHCVHLPPPDGALVSREQRCPLPVCVPLIGSRQHVLCTQTR